MKAYWKGSVVVRVMAVVLVAAVVLVVVRGQVLKAKAAANRELASRVTRIQWRYNHRNMMERSTLYEIDLHADGRASWGVNPATLISPEEFEALALRFVEAGFWELAEGSPHLGVVVNHVGLVWVTLTLGSEVRQVKFYSDGLMSIGEDETVEYSIMSEVARAVREVAGDEEQLGIR